MLDVRCMMGFHLVKTKRQEIHQRMPVNLDSIFMVDYCARCGRELKYYCVENPEVRILNIRIYTCSTCPYFRHDESLGNFCGRFRRVINDVNTIPNWCPLPRKKDVQK